METNKSKDDVVNDSTNSKDSEEDESFVTKVRSRVSGLFSSSFSRLFKNQDKRAGIVRLRSNEEDEETNQPPRKRARGFENDALSSHYYKDNISTQAEFRTISSNESGLGNNTEPIAGPSYISQRDTLKNISAPLTSAEVSNKDKYVDSGYSSMANACNKQTHEITSGTSISMSKPMENSLSERKSLFNMTTPATPNRSLFADQSVSPQDKNTSLRSRRPSFNTSTFGSPSFVDRTLTTSKIMNSPFYSGSTIYGGASAYGRQLGINETRKQQLKNSFLVKPINKPSESKSFTSLSKTARRILETLEQCSTPMSDVKKVPLPTRSDKHGIFSKYVAANPYQKNSKLCSNKELLVPSVSDRLKMKQIQRLQDTTNEIRQIATSSSSSLNSEEYKIASDNQQKHTNKMKSKISSVRPKAANIEIIDNYILNPVPLMIPQNKLPKFDVAEFEVPVVKSNQTKETPVVEKEKPNSIKDVMITEKEQPKPEEENPAIHKKSIIETNINELKTVLKDSEGKKKDILAEYVFSKPLVIADNSKSIIAINNFKFSEPVSKKIKYSERIGEPVHKLKNTENKLTNGNICRDPDKVDCKKPSDPLFEKFKAPEGTWECQTCLIRNKSGITKCAACESPRVENGLNPKQPVFGLQFKKTDEWDCTTCLVRNKLQNNVCVACSAPKVPKPETNGIGNTFKTSSKGWECETCWVRNKTESPKCVACETARKEPTSKPATKKCQKCLSEIKEIDGKCLLCEKSQVKVDFPSHLRPSSDSWECGTCLIRNKNDLKICAACETPRETNTNEIKTETSNKKSDKWECPTCMVRNDSEVVKCPCCETAKPGVTLVTKSNVSMFNFGVNKTQFNFGIPKDMQNSNPMTSSTTSLFANKSGETATAPVFKFGIAPEIKEKDQSKTEPSISFPLSTEPKSDVKPDSSLLKPRPDNDEKEKPSSVPFQFKAHSVVPDKSSIPVFKFGTNSTDTKDTSATNPLFKFNPPPQPKTVENNFKIGNELVSEGAKKPEVAAVPNAAPPKSVPNPLFSFGSKDNNSKEQTGKPMFSFGGSSSVTPGGGFNFNQVKGATAQKPLAASSSFPSSSVQPSQNTNSGSTTLKNGGFNFGSTSMNSNRAAVFSFGGTQNPTETTQLPTSGFDFSTAVKPTGGFNFTSPTSTFDAGSAKPTFNFTGGSVPTFSANPTEGAGGPLPVRKFKKAVRRTQR